MEEPVCPCYLDRRVRDRRGKVARHSSHGLLGERSDADREDDDQATNNDGVAKKPNKHGLLNVEGEVLTIYEGGKG
jgi:hypothetical protein